MENEPSSIKIVKSHMKQLGSIICEHMSKKESLPGKILVHQGLFVGSWGEMHGSKFLSEARMKELSDTFLEATKGSCPIAVRKPVQLRQLSCQKTASNINFTLFNDAIFGSETDLGLSLIHIQMCIRDSCSILPRLWFPSLVMICIRYRLFLGMTTRTPILARWFVQLSTSLSQHKFRLSAKTYGVRSERTGPLFDSCSSHVTVGSDKSHACIAI